MGLLERSKRGRKDFSAPTSSIAPTKFAPSVSIKPGITPALKPVITPKTTPTLTTRVPYLERLQKPAPTPTLDREVMGFKYKTVTPDVAKKQSELEKLQKQQTKDEKKRLDKLAGETRSKITKLLREPKTPENEKKLNQLRGTLDTAVSGGFERQTGFKTGLGESLLFNQGLKQAEKSGGIAPEVTQRIQEKEGFGEGKVVGELAKTFNQYGIVNKLLAGTKLGATLASKLGSEFIADQAIQQLADRIVQAPKDWLPLIKGEKNLPETGKSLVFSIAADALLNLVAGKIFGGVKKAKAFSESSPEAARALEDAVAKHPNAKTIQQELGLPEGTTAKSFLEETQAEDYLRQFDTTPENVMKDFQTWRSENFGGATGKQSPEDMGALKELYKESTGIDLDVAIKEATPEPQGLLERTKQSLTTPEPIAPQGLLERTKQAIEPQTPIKSVAEEIVQPGYRTTETIDLNDTDTFARQVREIIEPDTTLPKTTNELVDEGLGYTVTEPKKAKNLQEVIIQSPNLKDIGVTERWTTDVFRNFEKVFGENFDVVKKSVLDPFDAAKKLRVEDEIRLTDSLKKDVVDRLGIRKRTKESALVQQFGEKRISLEELKAKSPDKWQDIVQADKWFRQQYDELIDGINANRTAIGKKPIGKLDNYYRHFNEMGDTFAGIKNVFESNRNISPRLEGLSEFTRPGEKWASFKQRRTGQGKFKDDAVGGFLEYVKAGTYAKHIDPEIPKFRALKNELANATEGAKNMNHFIEFLDEYANGLSGKTGFLDRPFQKLIGRKGTAILNLLNSRMKSNAVLGNASSALSQIANVPQGLAFVKNPKQIAEGLDGYFKSLVGSGDKALYDQSGFLKERLTDSFSKFDTRLIDQPKKFAQWMLGALDETGTKTIWSSVYRKGLANGVENPIKYADDITRKMVAGRGIGEVPELQRQKLFQLVAPFTLEVGNLWKVQKDFFKKKDFAALAILYTSNFLLNNTMEDIRGSRVTFDPIDAVRSGIEDSEGINDAFFNIAGRLGGEVLGNIPTGQAAAQLFPEFGKKTDINIPEFLQPALPKTFKTDEGTLRLPSREEVFGETDPTRFGTQLPLARALQSPASSLLLPYGGQQVRKTKEGAQALGLLPKLKGGKIQFDETPSARTKTGKLVSPIKPSIPSALQGLVFGKSAIPEVKAYYKEGKAPFGEKQTANYDKIVATGSFDPNELFTAIKNAKVYTTKAERTRELKKTYSGSRLNYILKMFFNYN